MTWYSTPLHGASFYGHKQVVQYLTSQKSCDKSIKNKYNLTAEEESKDDDIKNLIKNPHRGSTKRFLTDKSNLPAFGFSIENLDISNQECDFSARIGEHVDNRQEEWKDLLEIYHSIFVKKQSDINQVFNYLEWFHGWKNKNTNKKNYTGGYMVKNY